MPKQSIEMWRRHRQNGLAFHLWELKHCGGLNPADKDIWAYESAFEIIKQYFWGAPKLRTAVTLMLSSDMSPTKRQLMIDKLNNPIEDWDLLLVPISLKIMGHAVHQLCHKVIVIEQAMNKATEDNATTQFRRRQTYPEEVDRPIMPFTYMFMREKSMMQKLDGVVRLQFKLLNGALNADNIAPTASGATTFCFGALDKNAAEWGSDQGVYGQL
ncbi:hypothetical protein KC343_g126 [Hortaea werneckii]|nr:hypothetical protein KC352_g1236 [Hortaea werneckii]KAI7573124.1 hypothetical protein KC317_g146 [Hortaea werneckii]KAI7628533.1 hypothetical protein KC346_g122 [Hortaea werneckii]KAI7638352.1 hypothetical protein KC343_g126 [Hortaea werneckii]KAI7683983.1 hypothetical protein KC319_g153 [Hortaea werneckii]